MCSKANPPPAPIPRVVSSFCIFTCPSGGADIAGCWLYGPSLPISIAFMGGLEYGLSADISIGDAAAGDACFACAAALSAIIFIGGFWLIGVCGFGGNNLAGVVGKGGFWLGGGVFDDFGDGPKG